MQRFKEASATNQVERIPFTAVWTSRYTYVIICVGLLMRLVWCSIRCGLVFISARSAENCISVERLNTLNTDLQSVLPNIKKLQPGKQGLFSLIPEAAVHMNFAVNLARFCRTPVLYYIDNHIQNRCSKKYRKIHWKTPFLESLFNKAAGLKPAILLKRHFSTGVFL